MPETFALDRFRRLVVLVALLGMLLPLITASVRAANDHVALIEIDGNIDPVSERFLSRAVNKATGDEAAALIIELDTPGGLLDSTRDMAEKLLGARIPTVVYVSPSGAQAASAGTFITVAANIAAMAPATNIGAASVISSTGEDLPSTLQRKVTEDTTAFIRSIASVRGRNAAALEATVTDARAYAATEAVELNVVDLIARDRDDLLQQIDGQTVETAAGPVTLAVAGLPVREIDRNFLERFLSIIGDPNIAFLLISIGTLALVAEFWTPGLGPGIVGVFALGLGYAGLGTLPVSGLGVGLIVFALILLILELQMEGIGIFGISAVISLVLGGILLFGGLGSPEMFDDPLSVSTWAIVLMATLMGSFLMLIFWAGHGGGSASAFLPEAQAALVGAAGVAATALAPTGTVRVGDQDWTATSEAGDIREGADVRVVAIYGGDVLKVTTLPKDQDRLSGRIGQIVRRTKFLQR